MVTVAHVLPARPGGPAGWVPTVPGWACRARSRVWSLPWLPELKPVCIT